MKIYAIANQKGGAGKTTTAVNFAAALAAFGCRTLLVDADPQCNATSTAAGEDAPTGESLNEMIYAAVAKIPLQAAHYIHHSPDHYDYIPGSVMLNCAPTILANAAEQQTVLRSLLRSTEITEHYEYCIIDTRPVIDLLTVNALAAADEVVVPLPPEQWAIDGLADMIGSVQRLKQSCNPTLSIGHIVICNANQQTKAFKAVNEYLREQFKSCVCETVIPRRQEIADANREHHSVVCYPGSECGRLYVQLANELTGRNLLDRH